MKMLLMAGKDFFTYKVYIVFIKMKLLPVFKKVTFYV